MKTPQEFLDSCQLAPGIWNGDVKSLIEQRDAEHRAELAAAQCAIEQLGKDGAAMATENERLKGELTEARGLLDVARRHAARFGLTDLEMARDFERIDAQVAAGLPAPPPAESTPVPTLASCSNPRLDCGPNGCATCPRRLPSHTYSVDCPCGKCGKEKASRLRYATLDPGPVAPPDDIRERLERVVEQLRKEVWTDAVDLRDRIEHHERRLSALEAKSEPGTFQHYFSSDGKKRCEVCGLPENRPCHLKGAKP